MTQSEAKRHITRTGNLLGLLMLGLLTGFYPNFDTFSWAHALLGTAFLAVSAVIIGLVAYFVIPHRKAG